MICRRRGSATALNASAVVAARAMGSNIYRYRNIFKRRNTRVRHRCAVSDPTDEPVDPGFELVQAHEPDGLHRAVGIDEHVRRHTADIEELRVVGVLVEQDRPSDVPDLAEALGLGARAAALPDVDEHDVEARPGLLPAAQLP